MKKLLYSTEELQAVIGDPAYLVVDCRFELKNPGAGLKAYTESHIPGALYAHLDDDLAAAPTPASGRHPLPVVEAFADFLSRLGWSPGMKLIVYDDGGGTIAARLWWLMKYFGQDCAALLDGGIAAWREAGYGLESGIEPERSGKVVSLIPQTTLSLSTGEVINGLESGGIVLLDARAQERFDGVVEPIDPVAGHVPGAVNFPCSRTLTGDGKLKPASELRESFERAAQNRPPREWVHMCGSGVTACLNVFAAELAGLDGSKLYAGSWSEWIRDPARPVEPPA